MAGPHAGTQSGQGSRKALRWLAQGVASHPVGPRLLKGLKPRGTVSPSVQRQLHGEPRPPQTPLWKSSVCLQSSILTSHLPASFPPPEQASDRPRAALALDVGGGLPSSTSHPHTGGGGVLCSLKVMPPGKALAAIDCHKSTKLPGSECPVLFRALKRRSAGGVGTGGARGVSLFPLHPSPTWVCIPAFVHPQAGAAGYAANTSEERGLRFSCVKR